ncbi:hypothetical protein GS897_24705, partial [Rhodococcus hoagii]|nr:hypothetical protein [Prescottella equi]
MFGAGLADSTSSAMKSLTTEAVGNDVASATAEYVPSPPSRSAIDTSAPAGECVVHRPGHPLVERARRRLGTVCTVSAANAAARSLGSWVNMQPAPSRAVAQAPARRQRT